LNRAGIACKTPGNDENTASHRCARSEGLIVNISIERYRYRNPACSRT
jgi:hypothetical protein